MVLPLWSDTKIHLDGDGWVQTVTHPPFCTPWFSTVMVEDYAALREWPTIMFAPQGLHRKHRGADSCLQTCVSAGYVVSNEQVVDSQLCLNKFNFMTHTPVDALYVCCFHFHMCHFLFSLPPADEKNNRLFNVTLTFFQSVPTKLNLHPVFRMFLHNLNIGQPCRCCTRSANCHVGIIIFLEAWRSRGWDTMKAASPQTRAALTSGTQWRTWRRRGPTPLPCLSTSQLTCLELDSVHKQKLITCYWNCQACVNFIRLHLWQAVGEREDRVPY